MKRLSLTLWLLTSLCAFGAARPHGWLGGSTIFQRDTFTESPPASISYPVAFAYGFNLGPVGLTPNVVLEGNLYKSAPTAPNITMTGGGGLAWSRTYYPPVAGSEAALLATGIWAPTTGCSIVVDSLPIRRTAVYFWAVAGDTSAPLAVSINGSCVVSNWVPSVVPGWRKFGPYECTPAPSGQITIASLPAQPCLCALGLWQEVPNQLPLVAITNPLDSDSFIGPTNVACAGWAYDPDGTVQSVSLVVNGSITNTCTYAGTNWTSTITNLVSGTFHIQAVAVDDKGGTASTPTTTITVTEPANLPPVVGLTSPTNSQTFTLPSLTDPPPHGDIPLAATATDSDGSVSNVTFYAGTQPVLSLNASPYGGSWSALAGNYAILAVATDNDGGMATSTVASITVTNAAIPRTNNPPTITLSLPQDATGYVTPVDVPCLALAGDTDGTVVRVVFYRNSLAIHTNLTAPYSFTDPAVAAGTWTYYATATDNSNTVSQSSSAVVNVQSPPAPSPAVNAGQDQSVQLPAIATLAGISLNTVSNLWSVVSSNGVVVLSDATATNSTAQFVTAGNYMLRLTGYGTNATASDDVNVNVLSAAPPATNSILVPVIVAANYQTEDSRTLLLAGVNPAATYYLILRGHDMRPGGKVSVSVNNSAYIPLQDSSGVVLGNAANYHGINGAYSTVRLKIALPAGTLTNGVNTLHFRHNQTASTYCAILDIQVQDAVGANLLTSADFVRQDPIWGKDYAPSYTNDTSVAAGQNIWENRLWNNTGQACNGCHRSIIAAKWAFPAVALKSSAKATFSDTEAEQIVSFIWWLKTHDARCYPYAPPAGKNGEVQMIGPWQPPYQPAPGLDALPAAKWSVGGGLDWILDNDEEMLPYMLPGGISWATVTNVSGLNIRQTPICFQLPDVLDWIPCQHPIAFWGSQFVSALVWQNWTNGVVTNALAAARNAGYTYASMNNVSLALNEYWHNQMVAFLAPRKPGPSPYTTTFGRGVTDTANWENMTLLSIMLEYEMEGHQLNAYSREPRVWWSYAPFDAGPNILFTPLDKTGLRDNTTLMGKYFTVAWYHVQLIVNPGNYSNGSGTITSDNRPMDWNYTMYFLPDLSYDSGRNLGLFFWMNTLKSMHCHDNTNGIISSFGNWEPAWNAKPTRIMHHLPKIIWDRSTLSGAQKAQLLELILQYYNWKNSHWTPAQFHAAYAANGYLPDANYVAGGPSANPDVYLPDSIWYAIPDFRAEGVSTATLNALKAWAASLWPANNWASR